MSQPVAQLDRGMMQPAALLSPSISDNRLRHPCLGPCVTWQATRHWREIHEKLLEYMDKIMINGVVKRYACKISYLVRTGNIPRPRTMTGYN